MEKSTATERFCPKTNEDVETVVTWALAQKMPLEITGHGSKKGLGRPLSLPHCLDMSQLTGVTLFEPEELVLSAKAGTPLREIEALLEEHHQQLQFEPVDLSALFAGKAGQGTLGGLVCTNICGPRRVQVGSVRDHILGIKAVSGRGEAFQSGGRVVKNVTGYDLSKGMTGSYGTLAVLCDITMKVMPRPETEQTLVLKGLEDEVAIKAMSLAMGSSYDISGAAHLPKGVAAPEALTLLRLEGFTPSVKARIENLGQLLAEYGSHEHLDAAVSASQWWAVRDCLFFADDTTKPLWRISCIPSKAAALVQQIRGHMAAKAFYDWQGGLVWLQIDDEDIQQNVVRGALSTHGGGHATLIRAHKEKRLKADIFQPQPKPLADLSRRYRENFNPEGILNPERMGCD